MKPKIGQLYARRGARTLEAVQFAIIVDFKPWDVSSRNPNEGVMVLYLGQKTIHRCLEYFLEDFELGGGL